MLPQSSVQISGSSSATCASRSSAPAMSVPRGVERQRLLGAAEHQVAAHAGGQVQHHVDVGAAHPLDHLAVERHVARAARRWPGRARGCGRWPRRPRAASIAESAICSGVTGTLLAALGGGAGAGHGAGDEDLPVHSRLTEISWATRSATRPSEGRRPRLTRWLGPQMLTITTGRPRSVEHRRRDAVGEVLELAHAGAVAEPADLRPAPGRARRDR